MSDGEDHRSGDWQACPRGRLRQFANEFHARDQRRNMARYGRAVAGCLVLLGATILVVWGISDPNYGGLSCQRCRDQFEAYHLALQGQETEIDAEIAERVQTHLQRCKHCRSAYEAQYGRLAAAKQVHGTTGLVLAAWSGALLGTAR